MKYSIILPVKNGSNHIKECIAGILSQSLPEFELIVLENDSTDNTVDIISSFGDSRIKIFPSGNALTIVQNWQRALQVQKGEFMTLIGHDDVLDKEYLRTMDELVRQHPHASLYQTHFRYIDETGKTLRKCKPMAEVQTPPDALHNFICGKTDVMGTGFMMRSNDYDQVGGIPSYPNLLFADLQLWIDLSRKGYMAVSPAECFAYRQHSAAATASSTDLKFLNAFEQFIDYLVALKESDPKLAPVITKDSSVLLKQYCQGLTHRALRTPRRKRETPPLAVIIDQFRLYARKLGNTEFEPLDFKEIRIGKMVDSNPFLHAIFLAVKKIYRKPVLKGVVV